MLPQRYRRLWRRRLRRRPLLPFLLAATVAVDLVIASLWFAKAPDSVMLTALGVLDAHLLLAAIYLAAGEGPLIARFFVALAAASAYGVLEGNPTSETGFLALSQLLIEAAACALVLAILPGRRRRGRRRTRILALLGWSTAAAIVSLWVRESPIESLSPIVQNPGLWFQVLSQALLGATALAAVRLIRDDAIACAVVAVVVAKIVAVETLAFGAPLADSMVFRTAAAAGVMLWLLGLRFERQTPGPNRPTERDRTPPAPIDLQV